MIHKMVPAALLLLTACTAAQDPAPVNRSDPAAESRTLIVPLTVRSRNGEHRFKVEVARTSEEQARGLMFRKSLDDNGGMLFPMNPPRTASFWMKNTLIPLDMLFIRTDGTIAMVAANTTPYSREPVSAGVPVVAVLELRGGRAGELGIEAGDRVSWGGCAAPGKDAPEELDFCPA